MAKSSSSELLSKLKTSLDKPTAAIVAPSKPSPPAVAETAKKLEAPPPLSRTLQQQGRVAPKLSITLYPSDFVRLDEIKEFMKGKGYRNLSDSEAIRLACRAVRISESFVEIYQEMKNDDGRRNAKVES
jgi:hypothetical protein